MAVLINGNGNEAIYAQQDADWFASIMGNQTAITAIGSKFAATLEDANTIGVADGVIITQEGRRIQLDVNELDLFDIPAGGQGQTNYYIIGYHLVTGDLSEQYCETFVRLMDNDTDTIPEDTFRSGADEVFVSLYRVTQVNLAITDMELLLPEITTVAQISQQLTVKYENGKTYVKVNGVWVERSFGMPRLNYDTPLHTFDSSHLSYTATKDCYLIGTINSAGQGASNSVSIDNKTIYKVWGVSNSYNTSMEVPLTPIASGQIVSLASASYADFLYILEEL